ncbi:MAG: ornithine cyclodeaminase [Pseudomonadota bacterium]
MPMIPYMTAADVDGKLTWRMVVDALAEGHRGPKAETRDCLIDRGGDALLSRAGWVERVGIGVKTVTVFKSNAERKLPTVQGAMLLFEDGTGAPEAIIDSDLVTKWKTAADSVLGASLLARPDSERLLILGAGEVARNLVDAYQALFPKLKTIEIWNRTPEKASALASLLKSSGPAEIVSVSELPAAVGRADIIAAATMSTEPLIAGADVQPGTHVDLIGAYKPDMREADDDLMGRGDLFVDCRETTLDHIGELMIPLASGVIRREDVRGDLYDLIAGGAGRTSDNAVTVFKNGGGAHLDVMAARAILDAASKR